MPEAAAVAIPDIAAEVGDAGALSAIVGDVFEGIASYIGDDVIPGVLDGIVAGILGKLFPPEDSKGITQARLDALGDRIIRHETAVEFEKDNDTLGNVAEWWQQSMHQVEDQRKLGLVIDFGVISSGGLQGFSSGLRENIDTLKDVLKANSRFRQGGPVPYSAKLNILILASNLLINLTTWSQAFYFLQTFYPQPGHPIPPLIQTLDSWKSITTHPVGVAIADCRGYILNYTEAYLKFRESQMREVPHSVFGPHNVDGGGDDLVPHVPGRHRGGIYLREAFCGDWGAKGGWAVIDSLENWERVRSVIVPGVQPFPLVYKKVVFDYRSDEPLDTKH